MKPSKTALLVVDVQMAFAHRDENKEPRSQPDAEANIALLLKAFRKAGLTICHIHHHSKAQNSRFKAELPGAQVQKFAMPLTGEPTYIKHVNSSFIGTNLEADLRRMQIDILVICGATANHCVETTTRMAGNLGFDTYYVADGVWAYGETGPDGKVHAPDDIHSMTLCNMQGEFATVVKAADIVAKIPNLKN